MTIIQSIPILAKFNSSLNITIQLPEGETTHSLASIKWYKPTEDRRSRFHCQIDKDDMNICNIELWKKDFYELSRDCIVPVHNILG